MGARNPNGGALAALCALVGLMAEHGGGVATPSICKAPLVGLHPMWGGSGTHLGVGDHNLSWEQGLTERVAAQVPGQGGRGRGKGLYKAGAESAAPQTSLGDGLWVCHLIPNPV